MREIVFGDLYPKFEMVVVTILMCRFCENDFRLIHMALDHESYVKIFVRSDIYKNTHPLSPRDILFKKCISLTNSSG